MFDRNLDVDLWSYWFWITDRFFFALTRVRFGLELLPSVEPHNYLVRWVKNSGKT